MTDLEDRLRSTLATWAAEAPAPTPWSPEVPLRTLAPAPRRRPAVRWLPPVAAAVLVGIVATVVVMRRDEERPVLTGPGLIQSTIRVGGALGVRVVAVDDLTGAVFVASENDGRLYRIDPETEDVTEGPELWAPDVVGAAGGSVYVVLSDPVRIARLDADTFDELVSAEIAGTPLSTRPTAGRLWVRTAEQQLVRMDLETLEALPEVPFEHGAGFLAEGPSGVWYSDIDNDELVQLDPDTGAALATIAVDGRPHGLAVSDDAIWVANELRDEVLRVDADDHTVTVVPNVGRRPNGVALDGDRVLVTTFGDGRLLGIDARTAQIVTTVPVGMRPGAIVVQDGSVWVSVHQRGALVRLDRQRLETTGRTTPAWEDTVVELDDGAHLFMRCMGAGSPTVVLEGRTGADIGEWSFVQPALAEHTRACAYDRATISDEEPVAAARSGRDYAAELRNALAQSGNAGPYVLVGDGYGALYVRLFAAEHPADVAGLVLIDPMSPTFVDEMRPLLDAEALDQLEASFEEGELRRADETFAQVIEAGDLGDLPLAIIVPDLLADPDDPVGRLASAHQQAQADLSTQSTLEVAKGVGLGIPMEAPTVVVQAILTLISDLR